MFSSPAAVVRSILVIAGLTFVTLLALAVAAADSQWRINHDLILAAQLVGIPAALSLALAVMPSVRRIDIMKVALQMLVVAAVARFAAGDPHALVDSGLTLAALLMMFYSSSIELFRRRLRAYPTELFEVIEIEEGRQRRRRRDSAASQMTNPTQRDFGRQDVPLAR